MFDLLIKNGRVVDPSRGIDGDLDVAVAAGHVAALDRGIPDDAAYQIFDASEGVVLPGLIDFHTHVFHDFTYWGVEPDSIGSLSGVTTWVDAGSPGGNHTARLPALHRGEQDRARPHLPQHRLHRTHRSRFRTPEHGVLRR
jgi:predicted amidohydrolase